MMPLKAEIISGAMWIEGSPVFRMEGLSYLPLVQRERLGQLLAQAVRSLPEEAQREIRTILAR